MGFLATSNVVLFLVFLVSLVHFSTEQMLYHNGPLLTGNISVNLIWYGKFKSSQRAIIFDFIYSITSPKPTVPEPSVATWWKTMEKYYQLSKKPSLILSLGTQIFDENYSLGKSLTNQQIVQLASKGAQENAINVVLTSADVAVPGFCSDRCETHGSALGSSNGHIKGKSSKFAYIWVGNSDTQCLDHCAWPFYYMHLKLPIPQQNPLIAPNNDIGLDAMVLKLASQLAGTVTNPFGNGYYSDLTKDASEEAGTACPGMFGSGATYVEDYGHLLVDNTTGASYNAYGVNGRMYLLPALLDPSTQSCVFLV